MPENTLQKIKALPKQSVETLNDALGLAVTLEDPMPWLRWIRWEAMLLRTGESLEIVRKTYFEGGKYNFDDYMVACEWNREPKARFWLPRRRVLEEKHHIATQIQEFIDDPDTLYLGFSMPPGTGKLLSDDTPIITKTGWKKHGDLTVGDEVIGMDGEFKKVIRVFPKNIANCRVHFSDGSYIDCHENHEWVLYDRNVRRVRVVETKEILASRVSDRFYIDRVRVMGEEKSLPVEPYSFGAWLGDGENRHPRICNGVGDEAIISGIVSDGYALTKKYRFSCGRYSFYSFKSLRKPLQSIGMCQSQVRTRKRIPEVYLTSSVEQRLELLAGLIDTDGCYISDKNRYYLTTKCSDLKDDFVMLITSLGWQSNVYKRTHRDGKTTWSVAFNADISVPCRLERKRNHTQTLRYSRLKVERVSRIEPKQGNCIEVEGGIYLAGKNMHPTHNSTLIKFLLAYIAGKYPSSANMYCAYSDGMIKMMLDSERAILTDTAEYCHNDIFKNDAPVISAEYKTISYRKAGDFPTLGLVSLGGSVTGRTRANKFLVTDDLVKNKEEARSPERLEKLYGDYLATLTTRMIGDNVKQIQLGTIWSAYDPISRMKAEHEGDPRYKFIAIPVWDENEVSNFEYDHPDRYTTQKIRDIKNTIDSADFECLFMQHGIEKEGLAFASDSLNYYNGVLPDGEPDNICFVNDVAWGGGDSLSMPIAYVYGNDVYIHDWVFDRRDKSCTKPRVVAKILQHKIKMGRTEANNGGDEYSDDVYRILRQEHGYSINMSHKKAPTNMAKLTRIEQHAPTIRSFYFRQDSCRDEDYRRAMNELTGFSFTTKNIHDDAADSLAMLADYLGNGIKSVSVAKRLF